MTGIANLSTRYRELGRLRMGEQVETRNGHKRPSKLDTWRFTSTDWRLIQRAAELYGGTPSRWDDAPSGTRQFQVTTDHDAIPVILPPDVAISQAMEAWTAAGCIRRCDGQVDYISGAECLCQDEGDQAPCKPTTRLSVMLPDMPGLGVWRVETKGWFAARELVPMVRMAATLGANQTFRLRIDPRHMDRRDESGKPQTFHFGVPVLDTDLTPGQLLAITSGAGSSRGSGDAAPGSPAPALSPSTPEQEEASELARSGVEGRHQDSKPGRSGADDGAAPNAPGALEVPERAAAPLPPGRRPSGTTKPARSGDRPRAASRGATPDRASSDEAAEQAAFEQQLAGDDPGGFAR